MSEFTPDPEGLRKRVQEAMGDRQIDNAPGYDATQVLPVVIVPPAGGVLEVLVLNPSNGERGDAWTTWEHGTDVGTEGLNRRSAYIGAQTGDQVELQCLAISTASVAYAGFFSLLAGSQIGVRLPFYQGGSSASLSFTGSIRFTYLVPILQNTDIGICVEASSVDFKVVLWRKKIVSAAAVDVGDIEDHLSPLAH